MHSASLGNGMIQANKIPNYSQLFLLHCVAELPKWTLEVSQNCFGLCIAVQSPISWDDGETGFSITFFFCNYWFLVGGDSFLPAAFKILSSLHRGHGNTVHIVPVSVYVLLKRALRILSLSFDSLIITSLGVGLFEFILLGFHWVSWMFIFMSLIKSRTFSTIISSNNHFALVSLSSFWDSHNMNDGPFDCIPHVL